MRRYTITYHAPSYGLFSYIDENRTSYSSALGVTYRSKNKRRTVKASSLKDSSSTLEAAVNHNAFPNSYADFKLLLSTCKLFCISVFTDQ